MITYLAVLKKDINVEELEQFLKTKKIRLVAHYKAIGAVKLESQVPVSASEFQEYFISIEQERDNLTI